MHEIFIEEWEYECADHCCYEWGKSVYVDGKQLPIMSNPEDHLDVFLSEVLKALGIEANVRVGEP